MPYKLSATLTGHTADVRAVASPTNDLVLSASRDSTAISWVRNRDAPGFGQSVTLRAGSRYINAVTYLPPTPEEPLGFAVTGGQDTVINVFALSANSNEPAYSLIGHTDNICALDCTPDGLIVSGSWDRTAKVWKDFKLLYDLTGHRQSVWAVLAVDSEQFLTGSADNTIKLWNQHKNVRTYPGHTQAVRGLALYTDIGFASCSNDSEIKIWTMEGDLVHTLSGHTSFVYSISVLENGDIVSGGEDRTVRIWRDGECYQTIVHPAISVWSVSTMPNGDIVTGCSDGVVRIFSHAESRQLPSEELKAYEDQVASQTLPAQQIGDVKKSDLPGLEVLSTPGNKPGEVKMIRNGDNVEAHQWDSASSSWQKIGDVVDAVGSGRKQLYEGKEYDYVFDVDVQEGMPPLKLPYNAAENPYAAAQRFLNAHELPLTYLDEVVKFIEKNTGGVTLGGGAQYSDPFTGASRYQPAQAAAGGRAQEYMDPFTGASRYRAAPTSPSPAPAVNQADPWTGSSRYSSAVTPSTPPPRATPATSSKVIPVRTPLAFRQANVSAMQAKLQQIDQSLRNEISTSSLAMYPQERIRVDEAFAYLSAIVSQLAHWDNPPPGTNPPTARHLDAIIALLDRWPRESLFPVMDLGRLLLAFCSSYSQDTQLKHRFFSAMMHASSWKDPWETPLSRSRETNTLFFLRALVNTFQDNLYGDGAWVKTILQDIAQQPYNNLTKAQRVACATILFNLSCIGLREPLEPELTMFLYNSIMTGLQQDTSDQEAAYRALVALGNILYAAREKGEKPNEAQVNAVKQCMSSLRSTFSDDRVKNVSAEIEELLR
ncbi:phospholipase A-2-activating protein [Fomitopsis serialis]|uniref:phospholipase A-2-activating protein n=1 Tax=Fomitopsis serialis TaxID=139415 RepID=UPI0020073223|nr:phospholipase A-2-activating protein [Neoantrodia serialis]KAH9930746.1 phospholipase A-2-activating protein [Neoantrodia serialis]